MEIDTTPAPAGVDKTDPVVDIPAGDEPVACGGRPAQLDDVVGCAADGVDGVQPGAHGAGAGDEPAGAAALAADRAGRRGAAEGLA